MQRNLTARKHTGCPPRTLLDLEGQPAAGDALRLVANRCHLFAAYGDFEPAKPGVKRAAEFDLPAAARQANGPCPQSRRRRAVQWPVPEVL